MGQGEPVVTIKLQLGILLLVTSLLPVPGFAAEIKDIRMWHAPERSRIVFDMDRGVKFKAFALQNPDRVVIDLPTTRIRASVPGTGTTGQFISRIRTGEPDSGTLRLVFDVAKPVRYFIQMLKPVDKYQYRLVVDYYHRDTVVDADRPSQPTAVQPPRQRQPGEEILVLIDPGHGGEDPGALGRSAQEKVVVLQISRKLKDALNREPGIRAELTRTGDYYIGLRKRTRIAREMGADLLFPCMRMRSRTRMPGGPRSMPCPSAERPVKPRVGWPTRKTRLTWLAV